MKGLGQRIRSLRKTRKLTLVEVAKQTGIDQATLSRIENGVMIGTLNSHMKIAQVLGLNLPDLYEDVLEKINEAKDKTIQRKLETFSHSSGVVAELLTTGILQKKMMPVLLKLKPKGSTEGEEYQPGAERFVYVLIGSVEINFGKEKKVLKQHESVYFNASAPHSFRSLSKSNCQLLSILTPSSL